jgi:hypothetical protein
MRTFPPQETDRVRRHTPKDLRERIDHDAARCVEEFVERPHIELTARIEELDRAWDVERALALGCGALALVGAAGVRAASAVAGVGLLWFASKGGGPLVRVLRRRRLRTRRELDVEKYALKALRGDFDAVSSTRGPLARAGSACQASLL